MLEMTKGFFVPQVDRLSEQYQKGETTLLANVNASKIEEVFRHFICMQEERLFFILELPASETDERKLRKSDTDPMHKDIYYIDGLTDEQALTLLIRYGELLINDGISRFGFGVQDGNAEIMRDKYNVITLWTNDSDKYEGFFEAHGIPLVEKCITAWDTFSEAAPGEAGRVDVNGMNVFDLPDELKDWGIYFYEQKKDD